MEKFDQPELHPRGFPLWINILLVSALILAPIVVVLLFQLWQEKQAGEAAATSQPAAVTQPAQQPESTTKTDAGSDAAASTKTGTEAGTTTGNDSSSEAGNGTESATPKTETEAPKAN